jgi:hypothetical protein
MFSPAAAAALGSGRIAAGERYRPVPFRRLVAVVVLLAWVFAPSERACAAARAPEYQHLGATPPPHGLPIIMMLSISSTDVQAGGEVTGSVETSANVAYVEARVEYRSVALVRAGPGKFTLSYHIPWYLPPWLRHGYTLKIVARTVDGVEAWRGIPIHVH